MDFKKGIGLGLGLERDKANHFGIHIRPQLDIGHRIDDPSVTIVAVRPR